MSARGRTGAVLGVVGELLITLGLVLALFVVYQVWWTDLDSHRRQAGADAELQEELDAPANPRGRGALPGGGVAFARLHIPALGSDYHFAVVEGTDADQLEIGPGHYTGTQGPGEPGNFAIAGHRVGRGSPFNDLDAVRTCDAVVYETRETWFVYRMLPIDAPDADTARRQAEQCMPAELARTVTSGRYAGLAGRSVVDPSAAEVVDPVPGDAAPADPTMVPLTTLTTCTPRYSAAQRMILHAALVRTEPREPGRVPAELEG